METKRKSAKVVVSVSALAALVAFSVTGYAGSLEPSAPPGPTMKTLDEVEPRIPIHTSDLPLTITEPNSYYLVEDLNSTDDVNNAITIECNDVTIDLMGYTLKGPDSGGSKAPTGIYIDVRTNVEVRNGTIRNFYWAAINSKDGGRHRVVNIRALSNGFGIVLDGYGHLIKDCTAAENGDNGIYAYTGSTVTGNTCYDNGDNGIKASPGCTVTGNTCYDNSNDGIFAEYGCSVTGNTAFENGADGIHTYSGCTVTGNTAKSNGDDGIDASNGCTVTGNAAMENTDYGIYTGGYCLVDQNTAYDNGTNMFTGAGCELGVNCAGP